MVAAAAIPGTTVSTEDQKRSSDELIIWLRAQLDGCEAKNRRVLAGDNWDWFAGSESGSERALREVALVRRIIEVMVAQQKAAFLLPSGHRESSFARALAVLGFLATIFDDAPGYQETWRP